MAGFIPYGRQTIEDDDIAAVAEVLRSDYLTTGPKVEDFEAAFAKAVGVSHAVACNSGTAALHLALLSIGAGPGDVAIVPAITFLATANAARYCGAEVVFADVDPASGLMTASTLMDAIAKVPGRGRLKAILPVHLAGRLVEMAPVHALARGAHVIADACHAVGSVASNGQTPAQSADLACYSFHPVKTMTTGEGGMVTAHDAGAAERLKLYRSHGMIRSPHDVAHYDMVDLGYNYRMPDILCALGLSQLAKLERFAAARRAIAAAYNRKLAAISPFLETCPAGDGDVVLHLYTVRIDFASLGVERRAVMNRLREAGIGTQVHYIPVHLQPYYAGRYGVESLPGAETWHQRTLSLPIFPAMDEADVDRVVDALGEALRP